MTHPDPRLAPRLRACYTRPMEATHSIAVIDSDGQLAQCYSDVTDYDMLPGPTLLVKWADRQAEMLVLAPAWRVQVTPA